MATDKKRVITFWSLSNIAKFPRSQTWTWFSRRWTARKCRLASFPLLQPPSFSSKHHLLVYQWFSDNSQWNICNAQISFYSYVSNYPSFVYFPLAGKEYTTLGHYWYHRAMLSVRKQCQSLHDAVFKSVQTVCEAIKQFNCVLEVSCCYFKVVLELWLYSKHDTGRL